MTVEPENRLHFPYIINVLQILICHAQGYVEMTFKEPKLLDKLISTVQVLITPSLKLLDDIKTLTPFSWDCTETIKL